MGEMGLYIRNMFQEGDEKRDAGLKRPEDLKFFTDIRYGEHALQVLDVYRPLDSDGSLPVIVDVHGGGWVYGDKERYQYYCMSLARHGFAVVNFSYRLAPEDKFPAALEDTASVFAWTREHASDYGFDMDHLFAAGDSAGAHILGLYLGLCTDDAYQKKMGIPASVKPRAVLMNCGTYEIETGGENQLTAGLMKEVLEKGGTEEELETVNVLHRVNAGWPAVYLMTCTGDFLMNEAPKLKAKLDEYGIPCVNAFYGDKEHELGHVFHLNMKSETAGICNDDECRFLKSQMI